MNSPSDTPGLAGRIVSFLGRRNLVLKALSFAFVGLINAGVDFAVFVLALQFLADRIPGERMELVVANVIAWAVAVTGSYVMNSYTTFAAESGRVLRWKSYLAFAASGILGVIANTAVLVVAAEFVAVLVAKILAIGAGFLVNFSMSHFVVFRPRGQQEQPASPLDRAR